MVTRLSAVTADDFLADGLSCVRKGPGSPKGPKSPKRRPSQSTISQVERSSEIAGEQEEVAIALDLGSPVRRSPQGTSSSKSQQSSDGAGKLEEKEVDFVLGAPKRRSPQHTGSSKLQQGSGRAGEQEDAEVDLDLGSPTRRSPQHTSSSRSQQNSGRAGEQEEGEVQSVELQLGSPIRRSPQGTCSSQSHQSSGRACEQEAGEVDLDLEERKQLDAPVRHWIAPGGWQGDHSRSKGSSSSETAKDLKRNSLPRYAAVASEEELEETINSPVGSPPWQQLSEHAGSGGSGYSVEAISSSAVPRADAASGLLRLGDVALGPELGFGRTGRVWSGLNKKTGGAVAVKVVSEDFIEAGEVELRVLESLDDPHIVRYLGHDWRQDGCRRELVIFMEQMPGLSIYSALQQFGAFDADTAGRYACHVLLGLQALHNQGICHRDLKSSNVLLGSRGKCHLADFGCSRTAGTMESSKLHTVCGSPAWMAPEVLMGGGYSYSADIWAVGCLVLEMVTGLAPWAACAFDNEVVAMMRIASGNSTPLDVLPSECALSSSCRDFVQQCLQRDPQTRSAVKDLLQHAFVADASDASLLDTTPAVPRWGFLWDSENFDSSIVKHDVTSSPDNFMSQTFRSIDPK